MAEPEDDRLFILGAGRVGTALAIALARAGAAPGLWTRSPASADRARRLTGRPCWQGALPEAVGQATRVIVAVSDPAAASLAGALLDGGLLRSAQVVLHCAGGRPAAEALPGLGPPLARGTFHPLLAIADPEDGARHLRGAAIALEGDEAARRAGAEVARRLGARPVELPAGGLLAYHTAAVLASNHAVALWAAALELLGLSGVPAAEQLPALLPLISSTMENLGALGVPAALTGPVRRGDAAQVAGALELLERAAPHLVPLYAAATSQALRLARALEDPALEPGLRRIEELLRSRA
jgi:predicted short-subunit dehydrogenase-like oxidoreductase (DUF2520 family)